MGHSGKIVRMDLTPPFALAVADAVLTPDELDPEQIVSGEPRVSSAVLHESPATEPGGRVVERGVWEITPGVVTDVEADEVFVVLAGRGTVTFEDGEVVTLAPGVAVRLRAGERTTWVVTETLRKVYQITYVPGADEAA